MRTPCRIELMVTEDGERWRSRSLPPRTAQDNRTAIDRLWVLGPNELVVAESSPTDRPGRWHSADAGQTWQLVPGTVEGSVEAVPAGGALDVECQEPNRPALLCTSATLVVTVPGSGRWIGWRSASGRPACTCWRSARCQASPTGCWRSSTAPTADRRLIVDTESGTTYVSADHGETFTPAHADVAVSQVWWTRVGYLATAQSQPGAYLSEDGRHWRKLTME